MKKIAFVCASIVLLLSYKTYAQVNINQSFTGIEKIEMSLSSGDVVFEKSTDGKLSVEVISSYKGYDPTIEKRGAALVINEEKMKNVRSWSGDVRWTLKLPDELKVSYNTGSGDVRISGLKINVDMNSGSGSFRIADSSGSLAINTGSGDVDVTNSRGYFDFNCGSGDIDLSKVEAEISANVGSGDISSTATTLTGEGSFNSGSGNVSVQLAQALAFDISVNSGSGDATLDFGGNKIEGLIAMEADKKNGEIEAPFEFDQTEEVNKGYNTTVKKTKQMGNSDTKVRVSTGSGTAAIKAK